jgi:small conductance mechanosensitive channel
MPELSPELQATIMGWAASIAKALILLVVVWIVAGWARRGATKAFEKASFDITLSKFISSLVRWAILLLGVLAVLGIFGVETTSFAAVLAGAGLAIGMAFSGTLGSFAAGVMLLAFRPFKIGDVVTVAGVTGKVDQIGIFTTTLDTPDNRRFILPNGSITGSTIENISHHPVRRADVSVGTDYSADVDRTREVLEKVAHELPGRLEDRDPQVALVELGASSVDWQVRIWVKAEDFWGVKEAATRAVKVALDEAGIGIPFPQMDVHLEATSATPVGAV